MQYYKTMFNTKSSSLLIWVLIIIAILAFAAPQFLAGAFTVALYIIGGVLLFLVGIFIFFIFALRRLGIRVESRMGSNNNKTDRKSSKKEGDVNIFTTSDINERRVRSDVGDYVDFEEVNDKE